MMNSHKKMFVAMPYEDRFRDVFEFGIKVAAERLGYTPLKVEDISGPIAIHATIIEEIYTSDVIVADITLPNPNVYYELGGSHAIFQHNKTIMIAREGTSIPFDLKVYQVVFYRDDVRGIHELANELKRQIEFIEKIPEKSKNPWVDFRPTQYKDGLGITVYSSEKEEPHLKQDLMKSPLSCLRIFGKNLVKLFNNEINTFGEALIKNYNCSVEFMIPGGPEDFKRNFVQFIGSLERRYSIDQTERFYNDDVVGAFQRLQSILDSKYNIKNRIKLYFTPFLPLVSMMFFDHSQVRDSYVRVKHILPTAIDTMDVTRLNIYRTDGDLYQAYDKVWDELKSKATIYTEKQRW